MTMDIIHTTETKVSGRLSVRCAFSENTIPTNRSQAISINVRILETSDSTADHTRDIIYYQYDRTPFIDCAQAIWGNRDIHCS